MWTIAEDLVGETVRQGLQASPLDKATASRLLQEVIQKYSCSGGKWPLWDGPGDDVSIHDESAWRWIGQILSDRSCVVFWDPETEATMLHFRNGTELVAALAECHRTEFYVTDESTSFLICFNHHDHLIAYGNARTWLLAQINQRRTSSSSSSSNNDA